MLTSGVEADSKILSLYRCQPLIGPRAHLQPTVSHDRDDPGEGAAQPWHVRFARPVLTAAVRRRHLHSLSLSLSSSEPLHLSAQPNCAMPFLIYDPYPRRRDPDE
jgi:hypothetical protein